MALPFLSMRAAPRSLCWALAAVALGLPLTASAQQARAAKWVNLRAGPARDYPLVAQLSPGTPLAVQGCTDGFGWCDVIEPGGVRGWVYAGNINYAYQGSEVPVLGYGAVIGLPIIGFTIGSYWGDYYRNRPWYGSWHRYENHRPPPRPVFRPPPPRPPGFRPPDDHRPGFRPPGEPRPPGLRPPGDGRPPGGMRPPGEMRPPGGMRPPGEMRPPGGGERPPFGRPGGERPPGAGRPEGGRPGGGGRPDGGGGRPEGGGPHQR